MVKIQQIMNEASVTLELDLDPSKLSEVQNRIHGGVDDRGEAECIFDPYIAPLTRSPHMRSKMTYVLVGDRHTYKIDRKMHYLTKSYFQQRLNCVRVKQEWADRFEIAWTPNIGLNIILTGLVTVDSSPWQGFDVHWLNMWYQRLLPREYDRATIDVMIGNMEFLTEFNTFLPAYDLYPILPWDYARGDGHALPIHKMTKNDDISHSFDLRLQLHNLLRVRSRRTSDGEWKDVQPTSKLLGTILEDASDLPPPSMWGYYYKVSNYMLTNLDHSEPSYVHDVISLDPDNLYSEGTTVSIALDCDLPCIGKYWTIENTPSTRLNNHSNYTSALDGKGWGPLKSHQIMYGNATRSPKVDAGHSSLIDALFYGRTGTADGYYSESTSHDPMGSGVDTTINYKSMNAKLILDIANTDPFIEGNFDRSTRAIDDMDEEIDALLSTGSDVENKKSIYKVRVRLLVLRETQYVDGKCKFK